MVAASSFKLARKATMLCVSATQIAQGSGGDLEVAPGSPGFKKRGSKANKREGGIADPPLRYAFTPPIRLKLDVSLGLDIVNKTRSTEIANL